MMARPRATAGGHKGPPIHIPASLAPTRGPAMLRLMRIPADKSAVRTMNRRLLKFPSPYDCH